MTVLLRLVQTQIIFAGIICLLFTSLPVIGQEVDSGDGAQSNLIEESPESGAVDTDEGSEGADSNSEFIERSLDVDIKTSRKEELMAWCRVLNLPDDGAVEELKKRLRTYYNLEDKEESSDSTENTGDQIIIESAKRSEYFEVKIADDEKEAVVRLSGDVLLTVEESKRNRKHQVQADMILFNESDNTISAVGNIEYIVDTNGRKEKFTGDSLTFEVNDWSGVILHGTSEREEEIDKKKVPFYFKGDAIKRASADILVLTDGAISSSDKDNPDYALKAKKIWITGPGEWSIFSATIYVGHIPVLYLPFYWKSGSDLLFNPVIGERKDKGYYIQTTLYLLGQKKEEDDFSMLGFGNSSGAEYDLVREGLYLVKKERETKETEETKETGTLKYTLDAYTGLGAATGISGSFPKLWENGGLEFYTSLGVSRSTDSFGKTHFNDGSTPRSYWNNSYIGSQTLPLRWGSMIDLKYKKWKLHLDWYSDPYYIQDFGDRKESFDWLKLFLGEEDASNKPQLISSMKWNFSGSHSFKVSKTSPWLSRLSLEQISASLSWKSKNNTDITSSTNPDKAFDPARTFFYPDKLVLPDLRLIMKGSLPNLTVDRIKKEESDPDLADLADTISDNSPIQADAPLYIGSYGIPFNTKLLTVSLNYGLDSRFYMDNQSLSSSWDEPSDINFKEFKATKINTTHKGNFQYGLLFWNGLLKFQGSTKLSGYYQTHEPIFGSSATIEDSTKLEDYKYSKFLLDNTLSLNILPLQGISSLSATSIKYTIDANVLDYHFRDAATVENPEYELHWINNPEDINTHDATASFSFKRSPFSLTSSFTTNIPPLGKKYEIQAGTGLKHEGFAVNINQKNIFENETWKHDPLNMSASWTGWKDEVTISQTALFDLEENRFSKAESLIKFWGFQARFLASYTNQYNWLTTSGIWEEGEREFIPSTLEFSFKRTFDPTPYWKNRIKTKTIFDTSWKINLAKPTDNVLKFKWTQVFKVYRFLDINISFSAINRSMFIYFSGWRDQLNITKDSNFFEDLVKSFNIFDTQDRLDSQFNMEKIEISLIHHLRNWDVTLEYGGWPTLNLVEKVYDWKSEFSIYIKWNPLPMFNQTTSYKDDSWSVKSFGDDP